MHFQCTRLASVYCFITLLTILNAPIKKTVKNMIEYIKSSDMIAVHVGKGRTSWVDAIKLVIRRDRKQAAF